MDEEIRKSCGVALGNKYVFTYGRGTDSHVKGTHEIREVCKIGGLKKVGATLERKRQARKYARENSQANKKKLLNHWAHSEEMNLNKYQDGNAFNTGKAVVPLLEKWAGEDSERNEPGCSWMKRKDDLSQSPKPKRLQESKYLSMTSLANDDEEPRKGKDQGSLLAAKN